MSEIASSDAPDLKSTEVRGNINEKRHQDTTETAIDAKKLKNDDNTMDPLVKLPEPAAFKIINYLNFNEMLDVMRVSKTWHSFVNARDSFIDKVVFAPKEADCSDEVLQLISSGANKRRYKNLNARFMWYAKDRESFANPIELYAPTLETLTVNMDDERYENYPTNFQVEPINFLNLRQLIYFDDNPLHLMEKHSFPLVSHLQIVARNEDTLVFDPVHNFLSKFPRLEVLVLKYFDRPYWKGFSGGQVQGIVQPKLKALQSRAYIRRFMIEHKLTLERLEIAAIGQLEFQEIIKSFKALKSLSFDVVWMEENAGKIKFTTNKSIESLEISKMLKKEEENPYLDFDDSDDDRPVGPQSLSQATAHTFICNVLKALPSLKELRFGFYSRDRYITEDILKFIAKNMRNLQKLVLSDVSDELKTAHQKIQNHPQGYVNSTFELVSVKYLHFGTIEQDFTLNEYVEDYDY